MDHESDWQVVTKKPPQKESIGTSIPKSTSFKRNIENSNHGASMKSLNKSPNSKQTPGILKIQPGLEVKKPNVSMNSLPQPPKMKTNTAKKVTNSIALFDLILLSNSKKTSSNMITPTARQANITAKKEAIEDLKPKTFIANKKKKQRISTVKKRLLLERLKNFKLSENTNIQQKSKDDEVFDFDRSLYCTVLIFNFFCAAELSDEEEREEVLSNAREVLSTFGTIESLEMGIEPLPSSSISAVTATVDSCDCVIARFGDYSAAQSATAHLQGLTFGGATVSLHLVSNNRPFNSVPSRTSIDKVATRSNVNIASPVHSRHDNVDTPVPSPSTDVIHSPGPGISQHMVVSAVESLQQQYALPATLFVENMLEEADARDPEETAELLNDIRSLCEGFPSLCSVWLEQRTRRHVDPSISSFTVTGSGSGGNDGDNEGEGASLGDHSLTSYISSTECIAIPSGLPWALIEFNDLKTAINCIHAIKSSKSDEQPSNQFHGQFLQPRLYNYSAYLGHQFEDKWFIDINPDLSFGIILHQFVEHDQLVDEEEKEDIIDDIRAILFSSVNLQQSSGDIAISFWESIQTQTMSTINSTDLDTSHLLHVLVTCSTLDACCTALDHLHSQVVTGSRVSASIVSMTIDQVVFSQDSTKGDIGAVLHCNLVHTGSNAGAVVAVTDCAFLTLSDSIDAKDRIDDEYEKNLRTELLLYIRNQIHSHYSSSEYIHIKRVALITTSNSSSNSAMSKIDLISVDSQSEAKNLSDINFPVDLPTTIVACISFNSHIDAERAMLKLDGSLVGGSKINVYLETNVVDQSAIIAEDDSDTHHVDQKNSISMKASAHRVSLVARLDIPSVSILNNDTDVLSPYSANTNRSRFTFRHDSRAINRIATARSIKAYERVTPRVTGDIESVVSIPRKRIGAESFSSMDGLTANTEAVTSRPPGESIYKEAKATPKLQKHVEAPSELPVTLPLTLLI